MKTLKSHNCYNIVESKMVLIILSTTQPNTLPNMKAIRPTTSEELHSQSEMGWTNERTNEPKKKTICPSYIYAGHKNHDCF